jgi:hypothetical protein
MMRIIIFLSIFAIATMLAGCGEMAHSHKVLSTMKKHNAELKAIQKYQKKAPSLDGLEQYATTDESKYYYNLLKQYLEDPTAIPATEDDSNPFFTAEARLDGAKKAAAKLVRDGLIDRNGAMRMIKDAEENAKHPVMKLTNLPDGATSGSLTFIKGKNSQYYKTKDTYALGIGYMTSDQEAVKDRLIAAFDAFLLPSDQWKKSLAGGKEIAERNVKNAEEYVALAKESLESAKKQNYDASVIKQRQDHLDDMEASLKTQQEALAKVKEMKIMMYEYTHEKSKNRTDSYLIHINWDPPNMVSVAMVKTLRK